MKIIGAVWMCWVCLMCLICSWLHRWPAGPCFSFSLYPPSLALRPSQVLWDSQSPSLLALSPNKLTPKPHPAYFKSFPAKSEALCPITSKLISFQHKRNWWDKEICTDLMQSNGFILFIISSSSPPPLVCICFYGLDAIFEIHAHHNWYLQEFS